MKADADLHLQDDATTWTRTDELLRAFFRREMPQTWVTPSVDGITPAPARSQGIWSANRSHFGLAASLAFLVAGVGLGAGLLTHPSAASRTLPDEALPPKAERRKADDTLPRLPPATKPTELRPADSDPDGPFGLDLPRLR